MWGSIDSDDGVTDADLLGSRFDTAILEDDASDVSGNEGYGGYAPAAAAPGSPLASGSRQMRTKRTWDGVFLPVSLSIFGEVLFLRLPWIVGQAGLLLTLFGIALCYAVSGFTTIALGAISTNGVTGDGGPYMMVSRTLGPQIGLVIGSTFVVANVLSSAMYLTGSAPAIIHALSVEFPDWRVNSYLVHDRYLTVLVTGSIFLFILLLCAIAKVEKWFRIACLALTTLSLVDLVIFLLTVPASPARPGFTGLHMATLKRSLMPDFDSGRSFPVALGILFPGVSGVLSGVCLSGELRNAAKAIPRGIGYAWVVSLVVYLVVTLLVAAAFERETLKSNLHILSVTAHPYLFIPGELCSCFAAVLAGIVGSSRVLMGMAKDDLISFRLFAAFRGHPLRTVVLCWFLVQLLLFTGDSYTVVSNMTSVIFLATFFALNASTLLSSASGVASWRPLYRGFSNVTAAAGALSCLALMFVINPGIASGVIAAMLVLLFYFDVTIDSSKVYWGDAAQPLVFYFVRKWLLVLDERKEHVRHWRPSLLHLTGDIHQSVNLINFANNLKKGGLYELGVVLRGDFARTRVQCRTYKAWLLDFIAASAIKGFGIVGFGSGFRDGAQHMLRGTGLGGMRPNTVLLSIDELLTRASHTQRVMANDRLDEALDPTASRRAKRVIHTSIRENADFRALAEHSDALENVALSRYAAQPRQYTSADALRPPPQRREVRGFDDAPSDAPSDDDDEIGQSPPRHNGTFTRNPLTDFVAFPSSAPTCAASPASPLMSGSPPPRTCTDPEGRSDSDAGDRPTYGRQGAADKERLLPKPSSSTLSVDYGPATPLTSSAQLLRHRAVNGQGSTPMGYGAASTASGNARPRLQRRAETTQLMAPRQGMRNVTGAACVERRRGKRLGTMVRGLFSARTADGGRVQTLLDKLRLLRQIAVRSDDVDCAAFDSEEEFVSLCRDVVSLKLNLLLSRNFEALDREALAKSTQRQTVDLWVNEDNDPVMFLTAHLLRQSGVWAAHARLRVVGLVPVAGDREYAQLQLQRMLRYHRIEAEAHIVAMDEVYAERRQEIDAAIAAATVPPSMATTPGLSPAVTPAAPGLSSDLATRELDDGPSGPFLDDPLMGFGEGGPAEPPGPPPLALDMDALVAALEDPRAKARILNVLMRYECKRNDKTAVVFARVDPPEGGEEAVVAGPFVERLVELTEGLPPSLLFSGGGLQSKYHW